VLAGLVSAVGYAQDVYYGHGKGEVSYRGSLSKKEAREEAVRLATVDAFDIYIQSFDRNKLVNYQLVQDEILANIDDYIGDVTVTNEAEDKKNDRIRVVVKVRIKTKSIDNRIQRDLGMKGIGNKKPSLLSFIFVAREASEITSFDTRVTKVKETAGSEEADETASATGNTAGFSAQHRKDERTTTGGSKLRKTDSVVYSTHLAGDINSTMTAVFQTGGFKVIDARMVKRKSNGLIDTTRFVDDFRFGDISDETLQDAIEGCELTGIQYLGIGTLDVMPPDVDQGSGLERVTVSVKGQIWEIPENGFAAAVASVEPKQYSAVGTDSLTAQREALKKAGKAAAEELVAQLQRQLQEQ